ncbi:MAG: hypothetical protein ABIA04_09875 [Pseudomonadota bacterium]
MREFIKLSILFLIFAFAATSIMSCSETKNSEDPIVQGDGDGDSGDGDGDGDGDNDPEDDDGEDYDGSYDGDLDLIASGGGDGQWASDLYTRVITFGQFTSNGSMEIGVASSERSGDRWYAYEYDGSDISLVESGAAGSTGDVVVTGMAFAEVDGQKVAVMARSIYTNGQERIKAYDENGSKVFGMAEGWGEGIYASALVAGDIDGDGNDEIIVGRRHTGDEFSSSEQARWYIYDKDGNALFCGGGAPDYNDCMVNSATSWGETSYVTDLAVKDIDGDGMAEIAIARKQDGDNDKWFVYEYNDGALDLVISGTTPKSNTWPTGIDLGYFEGKGVVGVSLNETTNGSDRIVVYDMSADSVTKAGSAWGGTIYATDIAFGDIDGDGNDEFVVGRNDEDGEFSDKKYSRWNVYDKDGNELFCGGGEVSYDQCMVEDMSGWGEDFYTSDVAMGDVDGDGRDEIGIARYATGSNDKWFVYDF